MTGAQILIETLIEQGATDIFGYPGGQVLEIYDEIYKAKDRLNHILTVHEQGASHAADGYARVTGKVGVVISTSGPGATNLVTGIATAMLDSIPMVAITGNVPSYMIGKDAFQEINITGITMPITKHNYFVSDVKDLAETVREAFKIAKSGRPGPVLIDIPKDVQLAQCDFVKGEYSKKEPYLNTYDIKKAVELINKSTRPYIYVGGGAQVASMTEEILSFAEKADAPIGASLMGLNVIPTSSKRFLGMQGMHGKYSSSMAQKEADLIIGVGVRFSDRATGDTKKYQSGAKIIQLDCDLAEIDKNVSVDVALVGDIKKILKDITSGITEKKHPSWHKAIEKFKNEEIKIESENNPEGKFTPKKIFDIINKLKTDDMAVCTDVGQHQMWTAQYINLEKTRKFASSGGLGTMGYGLGAAIGAYVGKKETTILITGDGSFAMNISELATAVSYDIPIIVVVLNNNALGMIKQLQEEFYDKRYSNSILSRKTDFVKVAEGYGAKSKRVKDSDEFKEAFEDALNYRGPYVIDVIIDENEKVSLMPLNEVSMKEKTNTKEEKTK